MYKEFYKTPEELEGKTIKSCAVIRAEHGRTCNWYLCFLFSDNTRHIVGCDGVGFYYPEPVIEEMKKAPEFFTIEDIKDKVEKDERKRRENQKAGKAQKLQEYKRLKKELGIKE